MTKISPPRKERVVSALFEDFLSFDDKLAATTSDISGISVDDTTDDTTVTDQRPSMDNDSAWVSSIENAIAPNFRDSKTEAIINENTVESLTTETANALSNEDNLNLNSESEKNSALKSETYENANLIERKDISEIATTQASSLSHQKDDIDLYSNLKAK